MKTVAIKDIRPTPLTHGLREIHRKAEVYKSLSGHIEMAIAEKPVPIDSPRLTLVALSGYSSSNYRSRAREAGFDHYFATPLLSDDFLRFLTTLEA